MSLHEEISTMSYERVPSTTPQQEADAADQFQDGGSLRNIIVTNTEADFSHSLRCQRRVVRNFIIMTILFSANHGCTVTCLALATARLGSIGAWQSGTLYLTYTLSALLGATYITKTIGGRNAMMAGMGMYCAYVGCFWYASAASNSRETAVILGAAIGGIGAGFIWTGQGAFFTQASQDHAACNHQGTRSRQNSTSFLAGIFAFIYLVEEVILRSLSTILLETTGWSWKTIFGLYTIIAIVSTIGMLWVRNYPSSDQEFTSSESQFAKVTAAGLLLWKDPKMKHMIGLNAVFGFAGAFVNSYVNGQVVRVALNDPDSKYVGSLSAWLAAVAAIMSLVLARVSQRVGKGPVLVSGAICFLLVAFLFVLQPNISSQWGWAKLLLVYALQGTGRATFESTLKATFADFFGSYEKEGAFANIILQNGLASAVGYVMTFRLQCSVPSSYCVEYQDGSLHNVLVFETVVIVTALAAILGYWRASTIHQHEQDARAEDMDLREDDSDEPVILT